MADPYGLKRPRLDLDMPSGHDMSSYYARDNERAGHHVARDTDFLTATYERYLHSASRGDSVMLCFVDFQTPAHAATAMDALQGYIFDENNYDSSHLRLQFARSPGAMSGGGHHHGKH